MRLLRGGLANFSWHRSHERTGREASGRGRTRSRLTSVASEERLPERVSSPLFQLQLCQASKGNVPAYTEGTDKTVEAADMWRWCSPQGRTA
jgi:hypothetical protein